MSSLVRRYGLHRCIGVDAAQHPASYPSTAVRAAAAGAEAGQGGLAGKLKNAAKTLAATKIALFGRGRRSGSGGLLALEGQTPQQLPEPRQKIPRVKPMEASLGDRLTEQRVRRDSLVPSEMRVRNNRTVLEISWSPSAGETLQQIPKSIIPAELLRVEAPSTDVRTNYENVVIYGKRGVKINDIVPQGNYAARIVFSDGHTAGIFPYDYLLHVAQNKFSLARHYIKRLRAKNKSRNPPPKPVKIDAEQRARKEREMAAMREQAAWSKRRNLERMR